MSKNLYSSTENVNKSEGRQYHTDLSPKDLADIILLRVDPVGVNRIVGFFVEITIERSSRAFLSYTGIYKASLYQ